MAEPNTPQLDDGKRQSLLYWPPDEVRADVHCPSCQHNLRGLQGRVVECPECGHRCDIAALIQLKWNRSWRDTPYMPMVMAPASVGLSGLALLGLYAGFMWMMGWPILGWGWWLVGVGSVWGVLMLQVWWRIGNQGLVIAALGHAVLLSILLVVLGSLALAGGVLLYFSSDQQVMQQPWWWATLMLGAAAVLPALLARRWHRRIKQQCVAHHQTQVAIRL